MIIFKKVYRILAMTVFLVFLGQASVQAGANLEELWPVEPNVQGATKTRAEFTAYDSVLMPDPICAGDITTEVYFFLRIRVGNSNEWQVVSGKADGTFCLITTILEKQQALVDFLNDTDGKVLRVICPECTPGIEYVHIRRVFNDVHNYEAFPVEPYGIMAEFELVVNDEPPPCFNEPCS